MEQRFAFVLRIWLMQPAARNHLTLDHEADALRGTLQAADSAMPIYFSSIQQLNQLILAALEGDATSNVTPTLPPT